MSLAIDKFFFRALKNDNDIMELTQGRIFNTARTAEAEAADMVPYLIITYEGMSNINDAKDYAYEGPTDTEDIGILCVATTRDALASLVMRVRRAVKYYIDDAPFAPNSYTLSASSVEYDSMKPCFYQTLRYACETNNN